MSINISDSEISDNEMTLDEYEILLQHTEKELARTTKYATTLKNHLKKVVEKNNELKTQISQSNLNFLLQVRNETIKEQCNTIDDLTYELQKMKGMDGVIKKLENHVTVVNKKNESLINSVEKEKQKITYLEDKIKNMTFEEFKLQSMKPGSCVVCMDKYAIYASKECGHLVFCNECRYGHNYKCPLCNKTMVTSSLIRIYNLPLF